jgi:hypothetical protein
MDREQKGIIRRRFSSTLTSLEPTPKQWRCFNCRHLVADDLHQPLTLTNKKLWLSRLRERISEALLQEVLVEVFGPQAFSTDELDDEKQNWA